MQSVTEHSHIRGLRTRTTSVETATEVRTTYEVCCPHCGRWVNTFPDDVLEDIKLHVTQTCPKAGPLSEAQASLLGKRRLSEGKLYFHRRRRRGDQLAGMVPDRPPWQHTKR